VDDCFRAGDPSVQAIEHHYLDALARDRAPPRSKRHTHAKGLKVSPSSGS
jgi:hypothetical protein